MLTTFHLILSRDIYQVFLLFMSKYFLTNVIDNKNVMLLTSLNKLEQPYINEIYNI